MVDRILERRVTDSGAGVYRRNKFGNLLERLLAAVTWGLKLTRAFPGHVDH